MISSIGAPIRGTTVQSLHNLPAVDPTTTAAAAPSEESHESRRGTENPGELSEKERREVEALRKRDREVKAHEQAHLAAAGGYARGGPQYTYKVGPDGKRYAVGGEVPIDVSEVPGDPMATLQKAMTIRRAALAPNNPSSADRAIAAKAAAMAAKARQEMAHSEDEGEEEAAAGPQAATPSVEPEGGFPTLNEVDRDAAPETGARTEHILRGFDLTVPESQAIDISI